MPDLKKLITLEALQAALPSWLKSLTKPSYNADEISDNLTVNKFVTETDKANWNAKGTYSKPSDGIPKSDLSSLVQASLDNADSALQFETDPTVPTWAKQPNKPSYTQDEVPDGSTYKRVSSTEKSAWNGKQNALSTTQMQAVNSGITSEKVTQIETNKTNILYTINTGVKNWFVVPNGNYSSSAGGAESTWEFTDGTCKVIKCTSNDTRAAFNIAEIKLPAGDYVMTGRHLVNGACDVRLFKDGTNITTSDVSRFTLSTESVVEVAAYTYGTASVGTILKPLLCTAEAYAQSHDWQPPALPNSDLTQGLAELNAHPFLTVPINHNMIYRGKNLGDTLTDAQHTALSSGNFTDLYLGDYWTKSVTIPDFYELTTAQPSDWTTNYTSYYTKSGNTYTAVTGSSAPTWTANTYYQKSVPAQTVTLKAVIADFDTFYAGYASSYAAINTHHAAVIVTGFNKVVWNKTNTTAGGYVNSLIHKWLVGSALPQIETWFGSAKVLSHQKLLTNAITGDAASGWAWSSQKIALLSENQMYGSKVWGNSKAANGGYEPGEAFKHLNVFNHIDANLLFGNKNIWLRDIASAAWVADLGNYGEASYSGASATWIAPAALILLS